MDGNANPCGELGECCIHVSKVQELSVELICAYFTTWCLLPAPHCQVCELKLAVLVAYCPSLILLDIISIPAIADYCGWEHHVFERADRNQDI